MQVHLCDADSHSHRVRPKAEDRLQLFLCVRVWAAALSKRWRTLRLRHLVYIGPLLGQLTARRGTDRWTRCHACRQHHVGAAAYGAAEGRSLGDRDGGAGLLGDAELDGIEDDLASNEEWEERASYSIRALETPQCNRRKQEGAGTELRVQDGGENANEGDYDCQEGHHGRCGAEPEGASARGPARGEKGGD